MRKKKPSHNPPVVKVIRDCRNAELDYYLPRERAKQLYERGRLQFDLTNGCYCTPTTSRVD